MKTFHRPELARSIAEALLGLRPGGFGNRQDLFLANARRTGKSTFLMSDLTPALENLGAEVVYVDLWSDQDIPVGTLIASAIIKSIQSHDGFGKKLARQGLRKIKVYGVEVEVSATVSTGTLAELLMELNTLSARKVVLIVDEAQRAVKSPEGIRVMTALKSARDQLNLAGEHRLSIVMTGSDRDKLCRLVNTNASPFFGSTIEVMPTLGTDYLEWVAAQVEDLLPDTQVYRPTLTDLFEATGRRPKELDKVLEPLVGFGRVPAESFNGVLAEQAQAYRERDEQQWMERFETMTVAQRAVMHAILKNADLGREIFTKRAKTIMAELAGKELTNPGIQKAIEALRNGDSPMLWKSDRGDYALEDPGIIQWYDKLVAQNAWPPKIKPKSTKR